MNNELFVAKRGSAGIRFHFQRLGLSGVGRVSLLALRRNDNCPAGRPCRIFQFCNIQDLVLDS